MERSRLLLGVVRLERQLKDERRTVAEREAALDRAKHTIHGLRQRTFLCQSIPFPWLFPYFSISIAK